MTYSEHGVAHFSDDRIYRYALSRTWDSAKPKLMFIGLNPSTADETKLDPTLRRVIRFADREGCGGLWMANLFAFRATNPIHMKASFDPIGPRNDAWLLRMAEQCHPHIIVGWGAHGGWLGRDTEVCELLKQYNFTPVRCLGLTKDGHPRHPLYVRGDTALVDYPEVTP